MHIYILVHTLARAHMHITQRRVEAFTHMLPYVTITKLTLRG